MMLLLKSEGEVKMAIREVKGNVRDLIPVMNVLISVYDKSGLEELIPGLLKASPEVEIISTGGTMAQSIKELKNQGAKNVLVACTHGLFVGGAKEKLISAGCDEIISTDTIENEFSKVRTAPCIAKCLSKKINKSKN